MLGGVGIRGGRRRVGSCPINQAGWHVAQW